MKPFYGVLVLLALLLTGCSTSKVPTHLYVLPLEKSNLTVSVNSQLPIVMVKEVVLPEYLNDRSLVYRVSDSQIVQAKKHLWADKISSQITQKIISGLQTKLSGFRPTSYKISDKHSAYAEISIQLNLFNGSFEGVAEVSGTLEVKYLSERPAVIEPFSFSIPLDTDGYPALVGALSNGVDQLTLKIASTFE